MSLFSRRPKAPAIPSTGPANPVRYIVDQAGAPAVDLQKVRSDGHVDLVKRAERSGISLSKRGLAGIRAQVALGIDHSSSMRGYFADATVQTITDRFLGFALQVDVDGAVPVYAWDGSVRPAVNVSVGNYPDIVNRKIWQRGNMGSTNLAAMLNEVRNLAAVTDAPLFAGIITDGSPDSRSEATAIINDLSRYPVFIKLLVVAEQGWGYASSLDKGTAHGLSARLVDNVNAQKVYNPAHLSDMAFSDAMTAEWDVWVKAAKDAGILL